MVNVYVCCKERIIFCYDLFCMGSLMQESRDVINSWSMVDWLFFFFIPEANNNSIVMNVCTNPSVMF